MSQYGVNGDALGIQAAALMANGQPGASSDAKQQAGFQYAAEADTIANNLAQLQVAKQARQELSAGI